ncbi:MAG: GspMb/PilO family protein [Tepidisphaeraceae bacterium]|jgi:hypothetical protein
MANFSLNKNTTIILIAGLAMTAVAVAADSYIEQRNDLISQANQKIRAVADARITLRREIELRRYLAGPGSSMTFDAATIEAQLLHLMRDWQEQTGVSSPSFQRISLTRDHGFTRLTFQLGASGGIGPVAGLLYRVETSPIVLRVDSIQLRPAGENASDVAMQLTLSALCRPGASKAPQPQVAAQDIDEEKTP